MPAAGPAMRMHSPVRQENCFCLDPAEKLQAARGGGGGLPASTPEKLEEDKWKGQRFRRNRRILGHATSAVPLPPALRAVFLSGLYRRSEVGFHRNANGFLLRPRRVCSLRSFRWETVFSGLRGLLIRWWGRLGLESAFEFDI